MTEANLPTHAVQRVEEAIERGFRESHQRWRQRRWLNRIVSAVIGWAVGIVSAVAALSAYPL